jgi:Protein of unknown function (DUF3592)
MTTESQPRRQLVPFLAGFFALFTGLCTIFALVVTVAEAWQEHVRAQWPEATAQIERCDVDPVNSGRYYHIVCRLSYEVDGQPAATKIYSRSIPSPKRVIWQYPPNQIGLLQEWVDQHPQGTPIVVHYDPAYHNKAVLVATDMPLAGPRTPSNLKVLALFGVSCSVLFTIARFTRPRPSIA